MSSLETLLNYLKDEYKPFVIYRKAFFFGYRVKPYQIKMLIKALKYRRVSFEEKETINNGNQNEYLSWLEKEDKIELLKLINELKTFKIKKHNYLRDIKHLIRKHGNYSKYDYNLKYLNNYYKTIKYLKDKNVKIISSADLKMFHSLLFGKDENKYSETDNHVYEEYSNNTKKLKYNAAKAKDKDREVEKAFELYNDAFLKEPELALIFEICLYLKLMRIHPFLDGNGRCLRMMLLKRIYDLGYEDAFNISFEYLKLEYQDFYLSHNDTSILFRRLNRTVEYEDPILYRDFVFFMLKLLIVAYKDIY